MTLQKAVDEPLSITSFYLSEILESVASSMTSRSLNQWTIWGSIWGVSI